jgi:hypothetical protein
MVKKMMAGMFFFMTGGGFTGLAVGASLGIAWSSLRAAMLILG